MINAIFDVKGFAESTRKYTPTSIGDEADVKKDSRISMLEFDLAKSPVFGIFGDRWKNLFQRWINIGAKIELFIQDLNPERIKMLENLLKPKDSVLDVYDFSNIPVVGGIETENFRNYHFTLFYNPKQLWTESRHLPGKGKMSGCEYNKERFTGLGEKSYWEARFEKYDALLKEIKIHEHCRKLPIGKR
ncbi:MAG TPA: hypothetical protein VJ438_00045 [Candidatus Nanoarchaeia archaeon]|nr:hypothetical protein [Candidatus Nanoarchaeia archaeon]